MTVKEAAPPAKDSRTRAILARILRSFRRKFTGTPLDRARVIMGQSQIHDLDAVGLYLGHPDGFSQIEHLQRVPYTERELRWAAQNGFVLTIVSSSMRQIAKQAGDEVMIDPNVSTYPHIVGTSSRYPQWRLISRLAIRAIETKTLGLKEAELDRRLVLANAHLALTMAYLDYAIYHKEPKDGLFLTATTVGEHRPDVRQVLLGGARRPKLPGIINVLLGRPEGAYTKILVLKPHKIPL